MHIENNKKTENRLLSIAIITGFGFMYLFYQLAHTMSTLFF